MTQPEDGESKRWLLVLFNSMQLPVHVKKRKVMQVNLCPLWGYWGKFEVHSPASHCEWYLTGLSLNEADERDHGFFRLSFLLFPPLSHSQVLQLLHHSVCLHVLQYVCVCVWIMRARGAPLFVFLDSFDWFSSEFLD